MTKLLGYPIGALTEHLRGLSDDKYRAFNESLTPSAKGTSLGVRMPALRKVAKQIIKDDPAAFLDSSPNSPVHEINLLHAIILAKEHCETKMRLARIRSFVPTISNWAVCDVFCNDLKPSGELREALLPLLRTYAQSEREFEVRFALVMLMLWYRDPEHIDETFRIYSVSRHEGYYAQMGAAWGLSYLYVDYPNQTLGLLKSNVLNRFTHNKAIQKCIESHRVSDDEKQRLKSLRR